VRSQRLTESTDGSADAPPMRHQRPSISKFNLILGAIALTLDQHGLHVMRDPVQQRRSQHRIIVKNTCPMLINPVGGDERGATLIAVTDDLKQTIRAELVDGQIPQFINAQHLWLDVMRHGALHLASGMRQSQSIDDLDSPGKQHRVIKWLLPSPVPEINTTLLCW